MPLKGRGPGSGQILRAWLLAEGKVYSAAKRCWCTRRLLAPAVEASASGQKTGDEKEEYYAQQTDRVHGFPHATGIKGKWFHRNTHGLEVKPERVGKGGDVGFPG